MNILLHPEWIEIINRLTPIQQAEIFQAILNFSEDKTFTDPILDMAWTCIKSQIKADQQKYKETCEKRKEAINKRWKKQEVVEDIKEEVKEVKKQVKKVEKNKFLDFIKLTDEEHIKLIETYWEVKVNKMMQRLNDYIWSKWDKYKSHYFTMLNWFRAESEKPETTQQRERRINTTKRNYEFETQLAMEHSADWRTQVNSDLPF